MGATDGAMMKPVVTIFADASFHPQTRLSARGAWIKADAAEAITHGGAFTLQMDDATHAELAALANALTVAHAAGFLIGPALLQSDSLHALSMIMMTIPAARDYRHKKGLQVPMWRKAVPRSHMPMIRHMQRIQAETGIALLLRHVKGHRPGGGRNWVNNLCDQIAKEERQKAERGLIHA